MPDQSEGGAGDGLPKAVLFDLDGTLIDSAGDLHASVDILLRRRGLPQLTLAQVISMIGNGVRKLVERAFEAVGQPLEGTGLEKAYDDMVEIYSGHLTMLTTLMPGAAEAVATLRRSGVKLAVVTNKPQAATETILAHFGLLDPMDAVIGGDAGFARKPAPDMPLAALNGLGVSPSDAVMVGDSRADIESAKAAGVRAIAVRGGYTQIPVAELGADVVVDDLRGLCEVLIRRPVA